MSVCDALRGLRDGLPRHRYEEPWGHERGRNVAVAFQGV